MNAYQIHGHSYYQPRIAASSVVSANLEADGWSRSAAGDVEALTVTVHPRAERVGQVAVFISGWSRRVPRHIDSTGPTTAAAARLSQLYPA